MTVDSSLIRNANEMSENTKKKKNSHEILEAVLMICYQKKSLKRRDQWVLVMLLLALWNFLLEMEEEDLEP
jgi:hypothetical protein